MKIAYLLIVFAVYPALALAGCRFAGRKGFADTFFPREASVYWRGIAAFMVIFAHLTIYLQEKGISTGPAKVYEWFGGMGVLVFFFLSGYGTAKSLQKKEMNLHWLISHLLWLWVPVTVIRCFFWFGVRSDYSPSGIGTFLLYIIGWLDPFWFIAVLMSVYVTVYVSKRFFPGHFLVCLLLLNVLSSAVFYLLGFEPRWYNGHLLFVFAAWLATREDSCCRIIRAHWWISLGVSAAVFAAASLLFAHFKPELISVPFKLLSGAGLSLMILVLSQKYLQYGSPMVFFGKMSLYLYVIHSSLYPVMDKYWPQKPYLVVFLSIGITLLLSVCCQRLEMTAKKTVIKR